MPSARRSRRTTAPQRSSSLVKAGVALMVPLLSVFSPRPLARPDPWSAMTPEQALRSLLSNSSAEVTRRPVDDGSLVRRGVPGPEKPVPLLGERLHRLVQAVVARRARADEEAEPEEVERLRRRAGRHQGGGADGHDLGLDAPFAQHDQ